MSPSPKDTTPLDSIPVGRLGIIPLKSCSALGARVNDYIVDWRNILTLTTWSLKAMNATLI